MGDKACEGIVALITGSSQGGTGTALAQRLAAEGAAVALVARDRKGLDETLAQVEAAGSVGIVLPMDLADPSGGRDTVVARVEAELGPVDVVVNAAAGSVYKSFEKWTLRELEHFQQLNVWAPWLITQQAYLGMRERGRGWILNYGSKAGEILAGPPFSAHPPASAGSCYGATKAALHRLTSSVAAEGHRYGIAANTLSPYSAVATRALVRAGWIADVLFEPLETMSEAGRFLCTADPTAVTGRIAYSLPLIIEYNLAVRDLTGDTLVPGWQPADLPAIMKAQDDYKHTWRFIPDTPEK